MSTPILQSLLLADHVYRDQVTGKHIICGVFSTIFFTPAPPANPPGASGNPAANQPGAAGAGDGTPAISDDQKGRLAAQPVQRLMPIQSLVQAGSPYVYFSVTELRERKMFELRYVDLKENRSLFQTEVPLECDDPLKTIEVSMPLPRLPLVAWEERVYALELVCEGQLLGSHRVLARISPAAPPPPAPQTPPPQIN